MSNERSIRQRREEVSRVSKVGVKGAYGGLVGVARKLVELREESVFYHIVGYL